MMKIGMHLMHEDVKYPTFATYGSCCFDLRYFPTDKEVVSYNEWNQKLMIPVRPDKSIDVYPNSRVLVPTGLKFKILVENPLDLCEYSIRIYARSGMALKQGLTLANGVGVVDADYQEQVFVMIHNISNAIQTIHIHDRIAQAELHHTPKFVVDKLANPPEPYTDRDGGFGSTGVS